MTFSARVKQELLRVRPEKSCCMLSELSALTQTLGSLGLMGGGKYYVTYHVESGEVAKRIFGLLLTRLQITAAIAYEQLPRFGGRQVCDMTVSGADARKLLVALRMIRPSDEGDVYRGVPRTAETRRCCCQAYLRGAFLGAGSLSDPEKEYRAEFSASSPDNAGILLRMLEKIRVNGAAVTRRNKTVVYARRGDDVATLLAAMGAGNAMMELENIRINREARGRAYRAMNCDTGNMRRQTGTGKAQADRVKAYSLRHGLSALDETMYELARTRMMNPDVSLEQLGRLLSPPASKSAVNYRMRKLMEMIAFQEQYDRLNGDNETREE